MKKYKIGYTTGAFDMFHIGHLNILQHAKEMCDYLIVGVSTDELIYSYKGKWPVIPFEERIRIVESIKYVDRVIPQTTLDKMQAWDTLHFNALFHGDDWKGSALYNEIAAKLNEVGCALIFLPHTDGTSSSLLLQALHSIIDNPR